MLSPPEKMQRHIEEAQRSRGYILRPSLSVAAIGEIIAAAREVNPGVIALVNNCYGTANKQTRAAVS